MDAKLLNNYVSYHKGCMWWWVWEVGFDRNAVHNFA